MDTITIACIAAGLGCLAVGVKLVSMEWRRRNRPEPRTLWPRGSRLFWEDKR